MFGCSAGCERWRTSMAWTRGFSRMTVCSSSHCGALGMSTPRPSPSPLERRRQQRLHMERLCDRFEDGWKAGNAPPPQELLLEVAEEDRPRLLRLLLEVERDYRE